MKNVQKGNKNIIIGNNSNGNNVNSLNTINNIKITKIINKPERLNEKQKEELRNKTQRPYLRHKLNQRICCFGYVVGKHKYSKRYTVINLVDINGRYVADHVQLDLKEDEFEYYENNMIMIKFKGIVKEYNRNDGSLDYEIDLIEKPIILSHTYFNMNQLIVYDNMDINIDKINDFITTCKLDSLMDILNKLRDDINKSTSYDFGENFIYSYIINQYMLNTATYNLYNNEFEDSNINEDIILDLIIISSFIFYILTSVDHIGIEYLFKSISYICDILQGVHCENKSNEKFKKFCINKLNKPNKKVTKLWNTVYLRKVNFGVDSNPGYDNFNEVLIMSYAVLNKLIK